MFNPFKLDDSEYKRDFDILGQYRSSAIAHIRLTFNTTEAIAAGWVDREISQMDIKSPNLNALKREPGMDRAKTRVSFLTYLQWVEDNNHILAPNMICYANPDVYESDLAAFALSGTVLRDEIKERGKQAEIDGDDSLAKFCNLDQGNKKFFNNSISGATGSPHNSLYYVSMHTTLTSTCRSCTSYANAVNEKLLASNRHYKTSDHVFENIAYIVSRFNMENVYNACKKYNLVAPTAEYVFGQVLSSTRLYWKDESAEARIWTLLANMNPTELAAFSYMGDLNSIVQCNDAQMREMYTKIMYEPTVPVDNPEFYVKGASNDIISLVSIMSKDYMTGVSLKALAENSREQYCLYGARVKYVSEVFAEYTDFIRTFIITELMPQDMYAIPTSRRKVVLGSDTDSSLYTAQKSVKWYQGNDDITQLGFSVAAITAHFSSQSVAHAMRKLSAQIGVHESEKNRIEMKPEFMFTVYLNCGLTKHYMSLISVKEGNVFNEPKLDVKGANLKNSKLPPKVRAISDQWYEELMRVLLDNRKLTPSELMSVPAIIEHEILTDIATGSTTYYTSHKLKHEDDCGSPGQAACFYERMWREVFAPKYGHIDMLPAGGIKLSVDLEKKIQVKEWVESLEGDIRVRLEKFLADTGKETFTQIIVPLNALPGNKIPEELMRVVRKRKMLRDLCGHLYIVLRTFGLNISNENLTRLVSDTMTYQEGLKHIFFERK